MTIVDRQGHVVTQGAFNHCMAALDEARGRAKQLSEDWDSLASRMQTLRKAAQLYREASIQDHAEHWDSKQTGGANCPVCLRASELRREADALVDIANNPMTVETDNSENGKAGAGAAAAAAAGAGRARDAPGQPGGAGLAPGADDGAGAGNLYLAARARLAGDGPGVRRRVLRAGWSG